VLKAFFENFAPPFPEKELRDGTPKKVKKLLLTLSVNNEITRATLNKPNPYENK
jgi:hypothetical protein